MKTNDAYTTTYYGRSRSGTLVTVPAGSPVRFLPGPVSRYVLDGNFDACKGLERGRTRTATSMPTRRGASRSRCAATSRKRGTTMSDLYVIDAIDTLRGTVRLLDGGPLGRGFGVRLPSGMTHWFPTIDDARGSQYWPAIEGDDACNE